MGTAAFFIARSPTLTHQHSTSTDLMRPAHTDRGSEMTVLSLAQQAAQSRVNSVPCRTYDADLWFAEDQVSTDQAQVLCQRCPLQAACLSEALARQEPCGVWGGELFERGQIVAAHKPKGRPRKDADEVAAQAALRLAQRLAEVSAALGDEIPELAVQLSEAVEEIVGAA